MYANTVPMNDIPPILHYLGPDETLADWRRLHPRWDLVVWESDSCVAMMHTFYAEFVPLYHSSSEGQRIRLLRLLLLHRYGGIAIDTRLRPIRSLHSWRMARRLLFSDDLLWLAAPPKCEEILVYLRSLEPPSFLGEWYTAERDRRVWYELATRSPISRSRFRQSVVSPPCPIRRIKLAMRYLGIILLFCLWKFKNKPVFKVFR